MAAEARTETADHPRRGADGDEARAGAGRQRHLRDRSSRLLRVRRTGDRIDLPRRTPHSDGRGPAANELRGEVPRGGEGEFRGSFLAVTYRVPGSRGDAGNAESIRRRR